MSTATRLGDTIVVRVGVPGPPGPPGPQGPAGSGGGSDLPLQDGSQAAPALAWINDPTLGLWRIGPRQLGLSVGDFRGGEWGAFTIANLESSPRTVRYTQRLYQQPLAGADETAALYARVDPSPNEPQTVGLYLEITDNQADTQGAAVKLIHRGHGDGLYIAQYGVGGAGIEVASFVDGSKGYISTLQVDAPNSTLFNALWQQPSIPNFGAFYADQVPGHAYTARKYAGSLDGVAQFRVTEFDFGVDRWSVFNDGATAQHSMPATPETPQRDSPELRLFGSEYSDGVAHDVELVMKIVVTAPGSRQLRIYGNSVAGSTLLAIWDFAGGLDLQLGSLVNVASIQGRTNVNHYVDGGLAAELVYPQVANSADDETSLLLAVLRAGAVTLKRVSQGIADSGGSGFRALRVPN